MTLDINVSFAVKVDEELTDKQIENLIVNIPLANCTLQEFVVGSERRDIPAKFIEHETIFADRLD